MKKIINGKMYNTETAEEIGIFVNNLDYTNFNHFSETLYRKRTGEFFIHGKGGPMTKYAEIVGQNSWCEGEKIIPMSFDTARQWAEEHLDADEYESAFGEVAEDDSTTTLSLSMSTAIADRARKAAAAQGISLSALIANLIDQNCK